MLDASVIILTHRRPDKLAACLNAVARSRITPAHADSGAHCGAHIECIVTIDGHEPHTADTARQIWQAAGGHPRRLIIVSGDHAGPCIARNHAIDVARGSTLIFFNDDVVPHPDCIAKHLQAQHNYREHNRTQNDAGAIISGDSPWNPPTPDTFFAHMLRETGMVFFHNTMRTSTNPHHDWGFRHAWMLNISIPAHAVRTVGCLNHTHITYGRDDDELAFRLTTQLNMPVLFCREAVAIHDHPMTPEQYLQREYQLGLGSPTFAHTRPECSLALFGRDILSPEFHQFARERAANVTPALHDWFLSLDTLPPAHTISELADAYTRHLPLKRAAWLQGYEEGLAHHNITLARAAA
jgi:GT2 family glycosyltransferase